MVLIFTEILHLRLLKDEKRQESGKGDHQPFALSLFCEPSEKERHSINQRQNEKHVAAYLSADNMAALVLFEELPAPTIEIRRVVA